MNSTKRVYLPFKSELPARATKGLTLSNQVA